MKIIGLKCEMFTNPIGIDVEAPALSWKIENDKPFIQTAYQIKVELADKTLLWDSGKIVSSCSTLVKYAGKKLQSKQKVYWCVQVWDEAGKSCSSDVATWEMGLLELSDWQAQWIGAPDRNLVGWNSQLHPAPYFRKTFNYSKQDAQARIYICGLGYYELYLNGEKVGDHVLDPVVTMYDRRVQYITYDVTGLLRDGENCLGVVLGNGWYNCHTQEVWSFDKASWRDHPKMLLQLDIDSAPLVVSDSSWRSSENGPIVFDGLRNGETYDARLEFADWAKIGFDDSAWKEPELIREPGGFMQAQAMPPCKVVKTLDCPKSWKLANGDVVYDMEQSMTGWMRVTANGPAGSELIFRYSERLNEDKSIDQEDISRFILSGDCQTDRYILKGEGTEIWEPRFTYHGFRYIQVSGITDEVTVETIEGRVVNTDFEKVGKMSSSNEDLNKLQQFTEWSYLGNFTGIPTDCPHREKNGWTGDAQLAAETGLFNYDAATAYNQWMDSFADVQRPNGQLPGIVPSSGWGFNWGSGPAWDSAFILIPWYIYVYTGNTTAIEKHYDGMRRYVDYCTRMSKDNLVHLVLATGVTGKKNALFQLRLPPLVITILTR